MNNTGTEARILHTMLRVKDLDQSIDFYTRLLGMKLLSRTDYEGGKFTLAFVGYGGSHSNATIELTYNWEQTTDYNLGDGFGHIAVAVNDIYATCRALAEEGVSIPRAPGPMMHGSTVIAFVNDPDGYKIELIEQ